MEPIYEQVPKGKHPVSEIKRLAVNLKITSSLI